MSIYLSFIPLINLLIISLSSLISVAFYTILERKVLGYVQIRKGPNKVGILGIFQPFSDALKLFSKSMIFLESANTFLMSSFPAISLILSMIIWPFFPFSNQNLFDSNFSTLAFLVISSLMVYSIMMMGWTSNSKYCFLGAIRSVAQMISYEVSFFLIVVSSICFLKTFNFLKMMPFQEFSPLIFLTSTIFIMWFISCIAETNRSPFDFAEGESELVSGFNVEFMGGWFALIFLAEYLSMISLSFVSSILFLGNISLPYSVLFIIFSCFCYLWVRGTFPRFRYDLLMNLNWKTFLPISISYVLISLFSSSLGL